MRHNIVGCLLALGLLICVAAPIALTLAQNNSAKPASQTVNANNNAAQPAPKRHKRKSSRTQNKKPTNPNQQTSSTSDRGNANTDSNAAANSNASRKRLVTNKSANASETAAVKKTPAKAEKPKARRCNPEQAERADLSGNYTGVVNYPQGPMLGEATLSINGNQFTLSAGDHAFGGRITAIKTCSYTAVTMMFGEPKIPAPGEGPGPPLPTISVRALKSEKGLSLKSVDGEVRSFSFEPIKKAAD